MKNHKLIKYLIQLSKLYKSQGYKKQAETINALLRKLEEKTIDELLFEIADKTGVKG